MVAEDLAAAEVRAVEAKAVKDAVVWEQQTKLDL